MIFKDVLLYPLLEERAKLGGLVISIGFDDIYTARKPFKKISSWLTHVGRPRQQRFLQTVKYTTMDSDFDSTFEYKFLWQATNNIGHIPIGAYDNIYTIRKPHKKILFPFVKHIYGHYSIGVVDGSLRSAEPRDL